MMKKKIIIIVFVAIAVLLLLPVVYFTYCNATMKGKHNEAAAAFLKENQYVINADDMQIPEAFGQKITMGKGYVFIFGELHGFSPTQMMDAQMLIYLNAKRGVRTYGAEIFSSNADELNEILSADQLDENRLMAVIRDIANDTPQVMTKDCFDKWKMIFLYNHEADAEHKIHVLGLLGDKQAYAEHQRDKIMAQTLQAFAADEANDAWTKNGCYCFVGIVHAFQSPYIIKGFKVMTFGSLLKQHQFNVTSMVQLAISSYCYLPKGSMVITPPDEATKMVSSNGPISYFTNIINLEKASKGVTTAIYSLGGKDTPFSSGHDFVGYRASVSFFGQPFTAEPSSSTLDYFQYVFLIRDHQAPKPL